MTRSTNMPVEYTTISNLLLNVFYYFVLSHTFDVPFRNRSGEEVMWKGSSFFHYLISINSPLEHVHSLLLWECPYSAGCNVSSSKIILWFLSCWMPKTSVQIWHGHHGLVVEKIMNWAESYSVQRLLQRSPCVCWWWSACKRSLWLRWILVVMTNPP